MLKHFLCVGVRTKALTECVSVFACVSVCLNVPLFTAGGPTVKGKHSLTLPEN